ncbi:hypothetical protein EJL05_19010 [Xanthomonas arboricola pv. pruni]|nr:hypothetical protein EJL05_19010 [Xanthomonas arboricola pv. pruni]
MRASLAGWTWQLRACGGGVASGESGIGNRESGIGNRESVRDPRLRVGAGLDCAQCVVEGERGASCVAAAAGAAGVGIDRWAGARCARGIHARDTLRGAACRLHGHAGVAVWVAGQTCLGRTCTCTSAS